jgi:glycosyltransferase involved in cell wall biosynthesis
VDEDFLKNARFPRRDEPYTFFSAGSLDGNKNHKLLIDAFARVVSRVPVRLRIAGDGPQRNQLVAQARELGIDAQISFLGVLDKAGMLRELGAADCFALSSRYETFGVVVIEAIAAGLPVVATRCGGPESVISADCGIVVESENVDAMAEAMLLMTESRESFKPEILKQYVARRFGPETYVAQLGILAGTVTSKKNALR